MNTVTWERFRFFAKELGFEVLTIVRISSGVYDYTVDLNGEEKQYRVSEVPELVVLDEFNYTRSDPQYNKIPFQNCRKEHDS